MHTSLDLEKLRLFCTDCLFHKQIKEFRELTRGGSSFNFRVRTDDGAYVVKLIPKERYETVLKLKSILRILKNNPSFLTADLIETPVEAEVYEDFLILVITYIDGTRITPAALNATLLLSVIANYKAFERIDFSKENALFPILTPKDLYLQNQKAADNLKINASLYQRQVLQKIDRLNTLFYRLSPSLPCPTTVIHGDAGLDNMQLDRQSNTVFFDFERMRYGYPAEDAAELLCSALLERSFFFPRKRFRELAAVIQSEANFSFSEWQYALNMHFLNALGRRLRSGKLFRSLRKDWLFFRYLQKAATAADILKSLCS
jgi:Ser/Thr protein kinase RdoA (MazF antagonist)